MKILLSITTILSLPLSTLSNLSDPPSPANFTTLAAGAFHPIKNIATGKCIVPSSPVRDGAPLLTADCDNSLLQLWAPLSDGGRNYRFQNGATQLCISLSRLETPLATQLMGCECCGQGTVSNAQWETSGKLPDVTTLRSRIGFKTSSICLDVVSGNVAASAVCNGGLSQKWQVGF
ncbi:hypothetical protein B0T14DRAFT_604156 [Immersiella caudata]|uniref:Ricin B lectin domain-containing protein n=1 Tax=Immersiella caudata TaxID=314043 RepID=A0AA39WS49_9PEZI|nr:hypothetical protein B0T14DRAFT_604156 [Immersiella caudata]